MSSERIEESSEPTASRPRESSDGGRTREASRNGPPADDAAPHEATIAVRGETIRDREPRSDGEPKTASQSEAQPKPNSPPNKPKSPPKEVSEAKARMQKRLPALDDDADVGVEKEQIVTRDGKADLAFTGTLLASAAPDSAPNGHWQEYRIYRTNGGKHVFSRVTRTVFAAEGDACEAEVFDPAPSSTTSQLLRSARELARSRPLTWEDAAVAFFGYDPLAKALYRKLSGRFDEHIS